MTTRTSPLPAAGGWFKSTFSNPSQECVEVRFDGDDVHIRDTKDNGVGPVITVSVQGWFDLLADVKSDRLVTGNRDVQVEALADGGACLSAPDTDTVLTYTAGEWAAFVAGVLVGEFDLPLILASA